MQNRSPKFILFLHLAVSAFFSSASHADTNLIPPVPYHEVCQHLNCRILLVDRGSPLSCDRRSSRENCQPRDLEPGNYEVKPLQPEIAELLLRMKPSILAAAEVLETDPAFIMGVLAIKWILSHDYFQEIRKGIQIDPRTGTVLELPNLQLRIQLDQVASESYIKRGEEILRDRGIEFIPRADTHPSDRALLETGMTLLQKLKYITATIKAVREDLVENRPEWETNPSVVLNLLYQDSFDELINTFTNRIPKAPYPIDWKSWYLLHIWPNILELLQKNPEPLTVHSPGEELGSSILNRFMKMDVQRLSTGDSIPLYSQPDFCEQSRRDRNQHRESEDAAKIRELTKRTQFPSGKTVSGPFTIITQTIACDEYWSLVEFNQSHVGWAKNADLKNYTIFRTSPDCERAEVLDYCREEVAHALGTEVEILDFNAENGIIAIPLVGFSDVDAAVNYEQFNESCIDELSRQESEAVRKRKTEDELIKAQAPPISLPIKPFRRDLEGYVTPFAFSLYENVKSWMPLTAKFRKEIDENVLRIRLDFELALGYDPFVPHEPLEPLLRWYEYLELNCVEACFVPTESEFSIFFNLMQPQNFRQPGFADEMFAKYAIFSRDAGENNRNYLLPSVVDSTQSEIEIVALHKKSSAEQIQLLTETCAAAREMYPSFARLLENYVERIQSTVLNHPLGEELRPDAYTLRDLQYACDVYRQRLDRQRGIDLEKPYADMFKNFFSADLGYDLFDDENRNMMGNSRFMKGDALLYMNFSAEQMGAFLEKPLTKALKRLDKELEYADKYLAQHKHADLQPETRRKIFAAECAFNPIESAKRIESLEKLTCVNAMIVPPQRYLVRVFSDPRKKGVLQSSIHRDRFFVKLNESCAQ